MSVSSSSMSSDTNIGSATEVLDDSASAWDLFALARSLSSAPPETVVLPTRPTVIDGADVLVLVEPQADEVLATFR